MIYRCLLLFLLILFSSISYSQKESKSIFPLSQNGEREIFKVVEQMPRFPGCEQKSDEYSKKNCSEIVLEKFIKDNLIYPEEAKAQKIEGEVYVQFIIGKDGLVDDIKVVKDIGYGCGEAAVAVIEKMNTMSERWIPGRQRGNLVEVLYTRPIKFKL